MIVEASVENIPTEVRFLIVLEISLIERFSHKLTIIFFAISRKLSSEFFRAKILLNGLCQLPQFTNKNSTL